MNYLTKNRYEELTTKVYVKVRHFAYKLCKNSNEADDLAQEAFLKAYKNIDRYRDSHNFERWVLCLLKNLYLDLLRKKKRRMKTMTIDSHLQPIPLEELAVDPSPNAEDQIINQLIDSKITDALNDLGPAQRELLRLVAIEQLPYDKVAELLNVPPGTVRSRLHRATKNLRAAYNRRLSMAQN